MLITQLKSLDFSHVYVFLSIGIFLFSFSCTASKDELKKIFSCVFGIKVEDGKKSKSYGTATVGKSG